MKGNTNDEVKIVKNTESPYKKFRIQIIRHYNGVNPWQGNVWTHIDRLIFEHVTGVLLIC